jgi:transcription initiation factor TFIIIB Brf1 subunit/transcription initiation factor TFIIB
MNDLDEEKLQKLDLGEPLVEGICADLKVSNEATDKAEEIARRADREHPVSRTGHVIAASAVYFACLLVNEKRTQSEVAEAAAVTEVSIRNCYQEIAEHEGYRFVSERQNGRRDGTSDPRNPSFVERIKGVFR